MEENKLKEKGIEEMGFLKTGLKIVGSVALGATGVASTVLRGAANVAGAEGLANAIGAIQDKSFETISDMWTPEEEKNEEYYEAQAEKRERRAESSANYGERKRNELEKMMEKE